MAKMVIVIEFEIPEDEQVGFEKSREMLQKVKPIFKDQSDVKVYGAIRETADTILDVLKLGS